MKFLIVFFLAATVFIVSATDEYEEYPEVRGIADLINNTINKIIANISDPLVLSDIDVDLSSSTVITGGMNISKLTITGVHEIAASVIDIALPSMALNMTVVVGDLTVAIKYWADMLLEELIPLYGQGLMNVDLEGIQLIVGGKVKIGSGISIQNVTVDFTLDGATFNLNGLINNPEFSALFSTALNDNFAEFCNTYHEVLSVYISAVVQAIMNEIFGAHSEQDWQDIYEFNKKHYKIAVTL